MSILISLPIVIILMILQTTFARNLTLLSGSADLLLIWIAAWALQSNDNSPWFWAAFAGALCGFVSGIPWYVYIIAYMIVVLMAKIIRGRLWQSPLMSMFIITIFGSLALYFLTYIRLWVEGTVYPLQEAVVRIIIPSIFLNLFLAIPFFFIVKDTARWVFKTEVE